MNLRAPAGRLRRRLLGGPSPVVAPPPVLDAALGAKFELTHRCNLRCAFCYTESPRATLIGPAELSDDDWRAVVADALDLGVLECVLTGGEPLLRRALTLELAATLGDAGVFCLLNTNGWHVDDDVADSLAQVPGCRVHISLDGACPETHDASRGVPGGWRRAVEAIDRLASRGVEVFVVHVLVPGAEDEVAPLLAQMAALGVAGVRLTPVLEIGAADGGAWRADVESIRRRLRSVAPTGLRVDLLSEPEEQDFDHPRSAFLVRPDGDVVPDSRRPVVFGNARRDGLAAAWRALVAAGGQGERPAGHVAYRDPDVRRDGRPPQAPPTAETTLAIEAGLRRGREKAPSRGVPDLARADATVEALALARRHRTADVRLGEVEADGGRHVRTPHTRRIHRLNATSAVLLELATEGTLGDAVDALCRAHPGRDRDLIVEDVVRGARDLRERGVMVAAGRAPA